MQLNIVKSPSADITRTYLRCRQDASLALGEAIDMPGLLAIDAADLPGVSASHCAFGAEKVDDAQIRAVDRAFSERGSRCLQWVMQDANATLASTSTAKRSIAVMRLNRWKRQEAIPGIMVLQARAASLQAHELLSEMHRGDAACVLAAERHLDDPKFELLLGLDAGLAVACVGLLTSGDAAMVTMPYTLPTHRKRGIGRLLADRAIEFAARATLRHVVVGVDQADAGLMRFYTRAGFDRAGTVVEYDFA